MSRSYRDLVAWQKSIKLVTSIYKASEELPKHELYGLTSQLRRAAVSVAANIAEGQGRDSQKEFVHFLSNAKGSLVEVETHLLIALNLQYIEEQRFKRLLAQTDEVARLIGGLKQSLQRTQRSVPAETEN